MADAEQSSLLDSGLFKIDRRYRESKYFLQDQLRYSEAVQDFRSVKQAVMKSTHFNVGQRAFQFAKLPVEGDL